MTLHEYEQGRVLAGQGWPFYALIQAAMRSADTHNEKMLRTSWPHVWDELQRRYDAPGGLLPEEANEGISNV